MNGFKIGLLTLGLLGMMSAHAGFSAKKIEKNSFDELTITLPSFIDQAGKKNYFNADYQTAENLCRYLGKQRHHHFEFQLENGKNLVAKNSIRSSYNDEMIQLNNRKAYVIYKIRCSGLELSNRESKISTSDQRSIKRGIRKWSIRLGL